MLFVNFMNTNHVLLG